MRSSSIFSEIFLPTPSSLEACLPGVRGCKGRVRGRTATGCRHTCLPDVIISSNFLTLAAALKYEPERIVSPLTFSVSASSMSML